MAEAGEDRRRLVSSVDGLEHEKLQVQAKNAQIVEENRALLDQLETLNKAVTEADARAQSLQLMLESATSEIRKLTMSANRVTELEKQCEAMDLDNVNLHADLLSAREDERSAVYRWRLAESTLRDLHGQVDRIEKEAREERERHEELIQRMERRRSVERELDGAAGRLKGAAATSGLHRNQTGSTVVSTFCNDILQDNTNLCVGIMELRKLLDNSNQEVENLREQIMYHHQPLVAESAATAAATTATSDPNHGQQKQPPVTLREELMSTYASDVPHEVHIHHHYHAPSLPARKERTLPILRPKRRPALAALNQLSTHRARGSASSTSTILSQTSRAETISSLASSPSIFDRIDRGYEYSQPSSPEGTGLPSPPLVWPLSRTKDSFHKPSTSDPLFSMDDYVENPENGNAMYGQRHSNEPLLHHAIPEEAEELSNADLAKVDRTTGDDSRDTFGSSYNEPSHPLRKHASNDSLISIAGMDIHTPAAQRSQTGDYFNSRLLLPSPRPLRTSDRILSSSAENASTSPMISTTTAMAGKVSLLSGSNQTSRSLLASVAAQDNQHLPSGRPSAIPEETIVNDDSTTGQKSVVRKPSTLSRRVGGWVRDRWSTGTTTPVSLSSESPQVATDTGSSSNHPSSSESKHKFRPPGVNQIGPILGLRPPPSAPVSVQPQVVDSDLLKESLAE